MTSKKWFLFFVTSVFIYSINAQPTIDTLSDSFRYKPALFGKVGTRNSFIDNYRAKILGVKAGVDYNNRVRLGIGYNQLYSSAVTFDKKIYWHNEQNNLDSINAPLHIWYLSAFGEYVYYKTRQWKFSIPLQFGAGETYYAYKLYGQKMKEGNSFIFVYEPAVSVEYKILKWFGVGADIGFRFIVTDYKHLNERLNSPTYTFKLITYYDAIYKHLKEEKKIYKKKPINRSSM